MVQLVELHHIFISVFLVKLLFYIDFWLIFVPLQIFEYLP